MTKRRRFTEKKIKAHLAAYESSDMTIAEYCHAHGISRGAFYGWRSRYDETNVRVQGESFVAVTFNGQNDSPADIVARLEHPSGCVLSFYSGCSPEYLSLLIKHL